MKVKCKVLGQQKQSSKRSVGRSWRQRKRKSTMKLDLLVSLFIFFWALSTQVDGYPIKIDNRSIDQPKNADDKGKFLSRILWSVCLHFVSFILMQVKSSINKLKNPRGSKDETHASPADSGTLVTIAEHKELTLCLLFRVTFKAGIEQIWIKQTYIEIVVENISNAENSKFFPSFFMIPKAPIIECFLKKSSLMAFLAFQQSKWTLRPATLPHFTVIFHYHHSGCSLLSHLSSSNERLLLSSLPRSMITIDSSVSIWNLFVVLFYIKKLFFVLIRFLWTVHSADNRIHRIFCVDSFSRCPLQNIL